MLMLKKIVDSRSVKLFVFTAMLITSGVEISHALTAVGAHHGIFLFSIFQIMKLASETYEALEIIDTQELLEKDSK
jgi:hypothetical protein